MYTFKAIDKAGNIFETSNQTNIFAEKKEEKFAKKNDKFINKWGEGDFWMKEIIKIHHRLSQTKTRGKTNNKPQIFTDTHR